MIYLTTSDYFIMFPSSFLEGIKDRMYSDRRNERVGVFDIDWDNLPKDSGLKNELGFPKIGKLLFPAFLTARALTIFPRRH